MKAKPEKIDECNLLISTQKAFYDDIEPVYCPILKEKVVFNSDGFRHLLYKSNGEPRTTFERMYKLKLLPLVIVTIKNATGVDEERDIKVRVGRKKNSKVRQGKAYSLVALVGRKSPVHVRVILNKFGNGNLTFRSVMKH
jgi:hypothetical protein